MSKKLIRVCDVMKKNFQCIDGLATVEEALNSMKVERTKCLIVNKRHDNDEFGMLLISDISSKILAKDRSPSRVNIYEIMQKPALTVSPNMDIRYCARLFTRFEISRAPVVENDKLLGIVSLTDMVLTGMVTS
jgi:CBS domain-containing protein